MKAIPAVGIVLLEKDSVLLVKHGPASGHILGMYGLPAGKIDPGETGIYAAVRELFEETGLVTHEEDLVELPKKYLSTILRKKGKETFYFTVFRCKKWSGKLRGSSETSPEWVRVDTLDTYTLLPNVREVIAISSVLK